MQYLVGTDIGTSGCRSLVVSTRGKVLAIARTEHEIITPRPGWAEVSPETLWRSFQKATKKAVLDSGIRPRDIACIGLTAACPLSIEIDHRGIPLTNAILYNDTRASREIQTLRKLLPDSLSKTGNIVNTQMILPKLLWIRKHQRQVLEKTSKIHDATSYLVFRLIGCHVMDFSTASEGGLLHIRKKEWWDDACDAVGISPDKLPALQPCHAVAGEVLEKSSRDVGVPAGTPVVAGMPDMVASALSVGVIDEGDTALTYGSTGCFVYSSRVLRASPGLFVDLHCIPNRYLINGCMAAAGSILKWFLVNLVLSDSKSTYRGGSSIYEILDREASKLEPGSGGVIVLPYFSGERTPFWDPHARGVIFGLTLHHSRAHIYRAILESIAYAFRHHFEASRKLGCRPRKLIAADGGARSPFFRQIVSNILNKSQTYYRQNQGAAAGAAFLASMGAGLTRDWASIREWNKGVTMTQPESRKFAVYSRFYDMYRRLYKDLEQAFKKVNVIA